MISNIFNSKMAFFEWFLGCNFLNIRHRYAKVEFPLKILMSPMRWNDKASNTNNTERLIHYRIEKIQLTTVGENRPLYVKEVMPLRPRQNVFFKTETGNL